MAVSLQILHMKLEQTGLIYVKRKQDMNLLAGGTDEPCANASIRGAIGKARSIAVGPGSEPPRVRAILFPQLGELTCANCIYGQPPSRAFPL